MEHPTNSQLDNAVQLVIRGVDFIGPISPFMRQNYRDWHFDTATSCYEWTRRFNKQGRPVHTFRHNKCIVYRTTCTEVKGSCPDGLEHSHTCHNKICIAPWHLVYETRAEHLERARRDGKFRKGDNSWWLSLTPEQQSAHIAKSVNTYFDATTPEQRSTKVRVGVMTKSTPEQRSERSRKSRATQLGDAKYPPGIRRDHGMYATYDAAGRWLGAFETLEEAVALLTPFISQEAAE